MAEPDAPPVIEDLDATLPNPNPPPVVVPEISGNGDALTLHHILEQVLLIGKLVAERMDSGTIVHNKRIGDIEFALYEVRLKNEGIAAYISVRAARDLINDETMDDIRSWFEAGGKMIGKDKRPKTEKPKGSR